MGNQIVDSKVLELVKSAFERAGGCVKRLVVDIGNGQKVVFVRSHGEFAIAG